MANNSSTPIFNYNRSPSGSEWQMNMAANRNNDLSKAKKEKKNDVKLPVSPKIDSNLNNLKILAKARSWRAKMRRPASTQTDPVKTKMMKDEKIDNQAELIGNRNQTTETDEDLLTIRTKDGDFIITSTRAVNTEKVLQDAASTQTYMPRSRPNVYSADELSDNEDLDKSNRELKKIEKRFRSLHGSSSKSNNGVMMKCEIIKNFSVEPQKSLQNYDENSDDSLQDDFESNSHKRKEKQLLQRDKRTGLSRNFFGDGPTPWSNFQDMVLGQRFLNARLSPAPQRCRQFERVTWSEPQLQIVNGLMNEANSLLEMFDQVAMLLGPDVELHDVSDVEEFKLPPKRYDGAILKMCDQLEARLRNTTENHEMKF